MIFFAKSSTVKRRNIIPSMKLRINSNKKNWKGTNLTKVSRDGFPLGSGLDKSPNSPQSDQLFRIVYAPPLSNTKHKTQKVTVTQKRNTNVYFHRSNTNVYQSKTSPHSLVIIISISKNGIRDPWRVSKISRYIQACRGPRECEIWVPNILAIYPKISPRSIDLVP